MKKVIYLVSLLFIIVMIGVLKPGTGASAAGFKYKDYSLGKYVKYYGTVPKYVVDGIEADFSNQPPIITERGIAYVNTSALFKNVIGAKTKFYKKRNEIVISFKGHTLKMYLGSTTAYFDDEEIEAPCEPFKIKYKSSKIIAYMVPSRFVAELFGLSYNWNDETSTVTIKVPATVIYGGEIHDYSGTKGKVYFEDELIEKKGTYSLIMEDTAMLNAGSKLFKKAGISYDYDEDTGIIELKYKENSLLYCIDSKITYINGLINRCPVNPMIVTFTDLEKDYVYLPGRFTFENLGFYYNWNDEKGASEIYYDNPAVRPDEPEETSEETETEPTETEPTETEPTETEPAETEPTEIPTDPTVVVGEATGIDPTDRIDEETVAEATDGTGAVALIETTRPTEGTSEGTSQEITGDGETGSSEGKDTDKENDTDPNAIRLLSVINTNDGYKFKVDKDNCSQKLSIPLPTLAEIKDINFNDDLLGCMTEITVLGDYSDYLTNIDLDNTGEAILQIQIYYDPVKNETIFKLFSDVILGYRIESFEDGIVNLQIDYIKNIYNKVVVLDAGHGGHDPGAQHKGYNESDLNLKIVLNCREYFKDTDIKVFYTRTDNTFLSLYERADFAEIVGADMFVAVHHNSSDISTAKGTSVYYGGKNTCTSLNGLTSEKLAWKMENALLESLGTKMFANGVLNQNFVVVRDSECPAVLLEIGFMSNDDELARLVDDDFSKLAAKTIVDTIVKIYNEVEQDG
ncbi:MAG: N-acetylmuramoyl-L-alanine amidase [Lachnospiraceae bacterium]|nr:N-acetylmuramoyl-L-alanine amidase [Lachnospiraceae bacterium]